MVKPCEENGTNATGTVSRAALLSVYTITATFEVAEFIPESKIRNGMDVLP